MKRIATYVPSQILPAADQNALQDAVVTARPAALNNDLAALVQAPDGLVWQLPAGLAAGTLVAIDKGAWKDVALAALYYGPGAAATLVGQAADVGFGGGTTTPWALGYTGKGGFRDVGGTLPVTNGNPPQSANGASWNIPVATNVWLYVDALDGAFPYSLKLYNGTAATIYPFLWLFLTGATGKRP